MENLSIILGRLIERRERGEGNEAADLLDQLSKAYDEWQAAQRLFSEATGPRLVEWAALHLKACEEHFMYLWHEARRAGFRRQVRLRS